MSGSAAGWVRTGVPHKHEYPYSAREPVYNLSPSETEGRTAPSHLFVCERPFCPPNPDCALPVQVGGPSAEGAGNGAEIDGVLVGRGRYGGQMLCDLCGRASLGTSAGL